MIRQYRRSLCEKCLELCAKFCTRVMQTFITSLTSEELTAPCTTKGARDGEALDVCIRIVVFQNCDKRVLSFVTILPNLGGWFLYPMSYYFDLKPLETAF